MKWEASAPPNGFLAPEGSIAITLRFVEDPPVHTLTSVFRPEDLAMLIQDAEEHFQRARIAKITAAVMRRYRKAMAEVNTIALKGCAVSAIWIAYNHPVAGQKVREKVASCFRRHNRVMISWCMIEERAFGIAVSPYYLDLEPVLQNPSDHLVLVLEPDGAEAPLS